MRVRNSVFSSLWCIAAGSESVANMQVHGTDTAEHLSRSSKEAAMQLAELSQAALQGDYRVDDVTKDLLTKFRSSASDAIKRLLSAHAKDQKEINWRSAAETNCNDWFAHYEKTVTKPAQAAFAAGQSSHVDCREDEAKAAGAAGDEWNQAKAFQQSFKFDTLPTMPDPKGSTAGGAAVHNKWIDAQMAKLAAHKKDFAEKVKDYEAAYASFQAKTKECTGKKEEFEQAACTMVDTQCSLCKSYASCEDSKSEGYAAAEGIIKKNEDERQFEYTNYKYMVCIINNLLDLDESLDKRTKAFEACTDAKTDLSEVTIDYPGRVEKKDDTKSCQRYDTSYNVCDSKFAKREYVDKDLFGAPYKCKDCSGECPAVSTRIGPEAGDVYVRWGHRECPDGATKLYTGYASAGHYGHRGSGANSLCLHPSPNYLEGTKSSNQNGALIYGTEYQNTGTTDKNHDQDAVCAMCSVPGTSYTQWGRHTCPDGQRTEYYGVIMANHYTQYVGEFVCVDQDRQFTSKSSRSDHNGNLWYTTEFEVGSLPSSVFKHNHEASCAQCTDQSSSNSYVRWGHRDCPSGAEKLYTGYVAGSHYGHRGSGYNQLCLHPQPTYILGSSGHDRNGALLYGTEYEARTSKVDVAASINGEAACALCTVRGNTYTQWGRHECPSNQRTEYKGYILAGYYTHTGSSEFVCVDEARQTTAKSSRSNHDGNLWYTTEYQVGSLPSSVFKHDHEASCAQCNQEYTTSTYVRWGHRDCADGAIKLYSGYAAGAHYGHASGGLNTLCLHPEPTYLKTDSGDQNGALLYGTEYQNTGALDKNHDSEGACAVCAVAGNTYTQWGRYTCPDDQRTEYKGMVMAQYYTQYKSTFVCVDEDRQTTVKSSRSNHDGNLWYTTEYEVGSLPSSVFKHDHEVSCAQCTIQ